MLNNLKNVRDKVEKILIDNPICRDSDMKLTVGVWKIEGLKLSEEQEKFIQVHCSPPESITRVRRKFQEQGKYQASPEVQQARRVEEEKIREHFSGQNRLL